MKWRVHCLYVLARRKIKINLRLKVAPIVFLIEIALVKNIM